MKINLRAELKRSQGLPDAVIDVEIHKYNTKRGLLSSFDYPVVTTTQYRGRITNTTLGGPLLMMSPERMIRAFAAINQIGVVLGESESEVLGLLSKSFCEALPTKIAYQLCHDFFYVEIGAIVRRDCCAPTPPQSIGAQ